MIGEIDLIKLEEASEFIADVCRDYYGSSQDRDVVNRLETIHDEFERVIDIIIEERNSKEIKK